MKYAVKVRRTVVHESIVEVEANNSLQAMELAEQKQSSNEPAGYVEKCSNWAVVSVKDDT